MIEKTYKDYFKIDSTTTMREQYKMLLDIVKKYTSIEDINIYALGDMVYFSVENIKNFSDYIKEISMYAYYNECRMINEIDFNKEVCSYDLRDDLKEVQE